MNYYFIANNPLNSEILKNYNFNNNDTVIIFNKNMHGKLKCIKEAKNKIHFFRISGDNHYADVSGAGLVSPFSKTAGPKRAAQYKALNSVKADFIAKPSYTIKKTTYLFGLMTKVDANISGYAGYYKNFKSVDPFERNLENAVNKRLVDKLNLNK